MNKYGFAAPSFVSLLLGPDLTYRGSKRLNELFAHVRVATAADALHAGFPGLAISVVAVAEELALFLEDYYRWEKKEG